jgi:hypothetical protein
MLDNNCNRFKEAVCIQTKQVYDSCKSKECVENLRVYICQSGQSAIDCAAGVKVTDAEIIWVTSDVEPVEYSNGFYSIELKYYIKVKLLPTGICPEPEPVFGLATYCKKIVLFGSCGRAKIFTSQYNPHGCDNEFFKKTNLPEAVVEVIDPVPLSACIVDHHHCNGEPDEPVVPAAIKSAFAEGFYCGSGCRKVYVTLGLFTIVKLQRNSQLLIPAYDFCVPDKECMPARENDPCEIFEEMCFPVDEFFPPVKTHIPECDCEDKEEEEKEEESDE